MSPIRSLLVISPPSSQSNCFKKQIWLYYSNVQTSYLAFQGVWDLDLSCISSFSLTTLPSQHRWWSGWIPFWPFWDLLCLVSESSHKLVSLLRSLFLFIYMSLLFFFFNFIVIKPQCEIYSFFKNLFYWSTVNLQCCVNFCCTVKWFSYTYIYILFIFFSIMVYHRILRELLFKLIFKCIIQHH